MHTCSRVHLRPRTDLFTPLRVEKSPPARSLFSMRVTEGRFCKSGESFTRVDSWTDRKSAHMPLRAEWTGTTTFVLKPQLVSSVAGGSRSEKGSESYGIDLSGYPSLTRVGDSHRYRVPVNLPKGMGTGTEMPMLHLLNYNYGSRNCGTRSNQAKVWETGNHVPIRTCMHSLDIHDTMCSSGLPVNLPKGMGTGTDCCH